MIKRKFEGIDGIYPDIEEFFDAYCDEDCFTDAQSIADTTEECIEYLVSECGYDEYVVDSDTWYNKIKRYLVRLASGNESCKKEKLNFSNKKLEARIRRLEKLIKNESYESDLDEAGARAAANSIAKQFGRMLGVSITPKNYSSDVINSPMYGWLPVSAVDEIAEDTDARFAFNYNLDDGEYSIEVYPTDGAVCLMDEDGAYIDPSGRHFSSDMGDIVSYPLSKWEGFNLSMVHDEDDDDDYNVEVGDDFNDYYDESRHQTRRPMKRESIRKLARRVRR